MSSVHCNIFTIKMSCGGGPSVTYIFGSDLRVLLAVSVKSCLDAPSVVLYNCEETSGLAIRHFRSTEMIG